MSEGIRQPKLLEWHQTPRGTWQRRVVLEENSPETPLLVARIHRGTRSTWVWQCWSTVTRKVWKEGEAPSVEVAKTRADAQVKRMLAELQEWGEMECDETDHMVRRFDNARRPRLCCFAVRIDEEDADPEADVWMWLVLDADGTRVLAESGRARVPLEEAKRLADRAYERATDPHSWAPVDEALERLKAALEE